MNSKNKGNSFERKIANLLSSKFEPVYDKKNSFRRNPDSGSFFGGMNESRVATHHEAAAHFGDIIAPPDFKFCIECKHYKDPPTIASFIVQHVPQWDKWIAQAEADARKGSKDFLLIIKYNRVPEIVITAENLYNGIPYKHYWVAQLANLLPVDNAEFIVA